MEGYLVNRVMDRENHFLSYHWLSSYKEFRVLDFAPAYSRLLPRDCISFDPDDCVYNYGRGCECRGLLCIDAEFQILVCNPTDQQVRVLPLPPSQKTIRSEFFLASFATAFGYDDDSEDFVIVRMTCLDYYDSNDRPYRQEMLCEMYGVKTGSWKQIKFPESLGVFTFGRFCEGAHVNGTLYWIALSCPTYGEVLLSLDLRTKDITISDAPHPREDPCTDKCQELSEVDGKLGCFVYNGSYDSHDVNGTIEIWEHKEKDATWEMLYSVRCGDVVRPLRLEPGCKLFLEVKVLYLDKGKARPRISELQVYDLKADKDFKAGNMQVYDLKPEYMRQLGIYDYEWQLQIFPYTKSSDQIQPITDANPG